MFFFLLSVHDIQRDLGTGPDPRLFLLYPKFFLLSGQFSQPFEMLFEEHFLLFFALIRL